MFPQRCLCADESDSRPGCGSGLCEDHTRGGHAQIHQWWEQRSPCGAVGVPWADLTLQGNTSSWVRAWTPGSAFLGSGS